MTFKRTLGLQLTKTLKETIKTKNKINKVIIPINSKEIVKKPKTVKSKFTYLWQFHHGDEL